MSIEISNPFESYFGQDGRPIGAGSLYIGVAGLDPQLNPIDVFYDREMTVPAMQPLNISGGYVWNCCAPTKVFAEPADYSLKVLGKNGEQVFYCQTVEYLDEARRISYLAPFSGAQTRTQADKNADVVSIKDFGAIGDGTLHTVQEWHTIGAAHYRRFASLAAVQAVYPHVTAGTDSIDWAAAQAALISGARQIYAPSGAYVVNKTLLQQPSQKLIGDGKGNSIISYTGTTLAIGIISPDGAGVRIYNGGVEDLSIITSTGQNGIDLDSLSEGVFQNLIIAGFSGSGIKLHTLTSGGCVYNRFINVKAQSCGIGFNITLDGDGLSSYVSDNAFAFCRANICTTGFLINGGNHNQIANSQIEACTTGISITEPSTASTILNLVNDCRFEKNTTDINIGSAVTETTIANNAYINGNRIVDNGARTNYIGVSGGVQHHTVSGYQLDGGSFRWTRTAHGGAQVPHTVFSDVNSLNKPVTVEIQNVAADPDARALRCRYGGDAGALKFGIVAVNGKITDLATTNGPCGSFLCAASATTVISNTAIAANSVIILQPINAAAALVHGSAKCLYISSRVAKASFSVTSGDGSALSGTEFFTYWLVN